MVTARRRGQRPGTRLSGWKQTRGWRLTGKTRALRPLRSRLAERLFRPAGALGVPLSPSRGPRSPHRRCRGPGPVPSSRFPGPAPPSRGRLRGAPGPAPPAPPMAAPRTRSARPQPPGDGGAAAGTGTGRAGEGRGGVRGGRFVRARPLLAVLGLRAVPGAERGCGQQPLNGAVGGDRGHGRAVLGRGALRGAGGSR